ncbi:hypothetical protein M8J77_020255 [Diaphorina citri]|nr:hypothetical protein M8J77_020255 [Diaphorina citri]
MLEKHIRLYDITVSENIKVERVFHEDNSGYTPPQSPLYEVAKKITPPPQENVNDGGHGGIKHSGPAKIFQYLRLSWVPREQ